MVAKEYFEKLFDDLRGEYPEELGQIKDSALFTYVCVKYFFLSEDDYDASDVLDCVTDMANDCSIDAICNNHTDEDLPLVFIQTKYTTFDYSTAKGEIEEIKESVEKLRKQRFNAFNDKVVESYSRARDAAETKDYEIRYFCADVPQNKVRKKAEELCEDNVRIVFGDEIKQSIEGYLSKTGTVEYGDLSLDRRDNWLEFEDSIVVNISARSLKALYSRWQTALLGLNLRYYVRNKTVDRGLEETITGNGGSFWYLNNGIVIVCEDYEIDGTKLKLQNFSIVNGGQTSRQIYRTNFEDDFYILCKVIKTDDDKPGRSSDKIAEASNSQKPIKAKDLAANRPEQRRLAGELKQRGFQYMTKQGMRIEKAYKDRTKHATIDQLGKIVLCSVLQRPWTRTNAEELYKDEKVYHQVYGTTRPQMMMDLLKADYYYKDYIRTKFESSNKAIVRNSRTFVLAMIVYVSYFIQTGEDLPEITEQNAEVMLSELVNSFIKLDRLIVNQRDDEKELFYDMFYNLNEEVLVWRFEVDKGNNSTLDESNFLKKKETYYKCLPKLNGRMSKVRPSAEKLFSTGKI